MHVPENGLKRRTGRIALCKRECNDVDEPGILMLIRAASRPVWPKDIDPEFIEVDPNCSANGLPKKLRTPLFKRRKDRLLKRVIMQTGRFKRRMVQQPPLNNFNKANGWYNNLRSTISTKRIV